MGPKSGIKGFSFRVKHGDHVAIIGKVGSGKVKIKIKSSDKCQSIIVLVFNQCPGLEMLFINKCPIPKECLQMINVIWL